jgi:hypothetical protein
VAGVTSGRKYLSSIGKPEFLAGQDMDDLAHIAVMGFACLLF